MLLLDVNLLWKPYFTMFSHRLTMFSHRLTTFSPCFPTFFPWNLLLARSVRPGGGEVHDLRARHGRSRALGCVAWWGRDHYGNYRRYDDMDI